MTPSMSVLEGTYDAATKTMTYVGEGVGPDNKTKYTQKMVTKTKADGTRVFTLYMKAGQGQRRREVHGDHVSEAEVNIHDQLANPPRVAQEAALNMAAILRIDIL